MLENDTSAAAVGKRLRQVRKLANLSREELAELAEVGKTSISYWEHATNESSQMTPRSMAKIIHALMKKEVECTERWLRTGTGSAPRHINKSPLLNTSNTLAKTSLSDQLTANLSEEIQRFTSLSDLAVITKVDTNGMSPALEKGDVVGGIWQPSLTMETEKICIIEIQQKLQVRRVKPDHNSGLLQVAFLTYDSNQSEPFEIREVSVEKVAPIIRVWR